MLNNFPSKNPLVNLGVALALLLNTVAIIISIYYGAIDLAVRSIGTLITTSIIIIIVWYGTKKGWRLSTWKLLSYLMITIGVAILLWSILSRS